MLESVDCWRVQCISLLVLVLLLLLLEYGEWIGLERNHMHRAQGATVARLQTRSPKARCGAEAVKQQGRRR